MLNPPTLTPICNILDEYYPNPEIPLQFSDPFTLLIAVILSAQCTDARVNQVTQALWKYAKTPEAILKFGIDGVESCIRPCGLYKRKAQAICQISKILIEKFEGRVPSQRDALEALPCVGRKTANVILSHAFHEPAFPVDTHVMRLARRWMWSEQHEPAKIEADLCELFPKEFWLKRHLQMIYFGRNYCKARPHDPKTCPACRLL